MAKKTGLSLTKAGKAKPGGASDAAPLMLDLERSVPVLATILANRVTTTGSLMFRKRHGLGSMEWKVLATLATGTGITGAQISQLIGLDAGGVSRVLKAFVARGIIQVEQSARHSNYQSITLTAMGRRLHDEAILTAFEREQVLLKTFSVEERDKLIDFLQRLIAQSRNLTTT
ncbi:MAG TPA: MarR family transcriptional regulator [Sphingobium sp.]